MKKKEPAVSVIMNCLNCEKYLREAIDSVYAQTYKDWEIIFWDNASTDSSAEIAKSYDSKLRYFRDDKTIPLGAARNKALEQCGGEYIAFLDCDDLWMPKKLEEQMPLFNDPKVGLVYTLARRFNSNGLIDKENEIFEDHFSKINFGLLLENYSITMSSVIISCFVLFSLSYKYDPILKYAEELDLFLRICYKYDVIRLNEYQTHYRIHKKMLTLNSFNLAILEREYILTKLKIMYQDIEKEYHLVLQKLEARNSWYKFVKLVSENRNKNARRYLLPYRGKKLKYFIAFFFSFFCSKLIIKVWNYRRKKVGKLPMIL